MTRDDLYGHYRRYYVPNNATLVVVGDIDLDETMERVRHHFEAAEPGAEIVRIRTTEPEQTGERRVVIRRPGTAAYLKAGFHAPAVDDPAFVPALVLDAVLTGAKGVNLWSSFRLPPPQRSARLYRSLVEHGLASSVQGAILPTAEPFLYTVSVTAADGTPLDAVEAALLAELDRIRRDGITGEELARARTQLHARMIFDDDSITNVAHQLGYFDNITSVDRLFELPALVDATTLDDVHAVAMKLFTTNNRTVARFEPLAPTAQPTAHGAHDAP
jgi:zinc protease